jgi:hypothetical protein
VASITHVSEASRSTIADSSTYSIKDVVGGLDPRSSRTLWRHAQHVVMHGQLSDTATPSSRGCRLFSKMLCAWAKMQRWCPVWRTGAGSTMVWPT